jgi:hypothetical protein
MHIIQMHKENDNKWSYIQRKLLMCDYETSYSNTEHEEWYVV